MLSFNFGNKNSYLDYGIIITKRPSLPSPKRKVSYIQVPGRDSTLRYDEQTYEDITIAVECTVKGENVFNKLDEVKAWLYSTGESDLIFSFQQDKKYIAQVVNSIDFRQVYKIASQFVIIFNCRPFKYAVDNTPISITTSTETSITNQGTLPSKPVIKVYCSGDGSFKINNNEILLFDIDAEYIILDSELEEAYLIIDGDMVNYNNNVSGEFPKLDVGNNITTYTGGVTKLEITPNWRWL